ncbi:MAG: DsrE family protein [Burkholderiales bacterium]|nr:DsrE family protein [Burkholderiales bacterium]
MKFGKYWALAALLAINAFAVGASAQSAEPAKAKVVFQVSDGDAAKWGLTLNNANNVQQELGAGKVDIEIVAYGPGIGMLKADATIANRVTEATHSGVKIVACENTMKAQKLTKADMNPSVGYVPAGVVEIMKRQGEGWAYIRP